MVEGGGVKNGKGILGNEGKPAGIGGSANGKVGIEVGMVVGMLGSGGNAPGWGRVGWVGNGVVGCGNVGTVGCCGIVGIEGTCGVCRS